MMAEEIEYHTGLMLSNSLVGTPKVPNVYQSVSSDNMLVNLVMELFLMTFSERDAVQIKLT